MKGSEKNGFTILFGIKFYFRGVNMKKLGLIGALLLLIASIIMGCGADGKKLQSDFTPMITGVATPKTIVIAADYLNQNIGKAGRDIGSQMLVAYENYLIQYVNSDADWTAIGNLYPYWDKSTGKLDAEKITIEETKALYENLIKGGFKFASSEGMVYPVVDYKVFLEKYGKSITEALSGLYSIKQLESDKPMAQDAALVISYSELIGRAYATEQYIQQYKKDPLTLKDSKFIYQNYINTMLLGMNNTPIFDYQTHVFSVDAKKAYVEFINAHPKAVTSWMLGEYLNYLSSANFTMDYKNKSQSKVFFDTCSWLVSEAGKKVLE